jgi:hypothetical protein
MELKDKDKWQLLESLLNAWRTHDGEKADPSIVKMKKVEDDLGPTGFRQHVKSGADIDQILVECVFELKQEIDTWKASEKGTKTSKVKG